MTTVARAARWLSLRRAHLLENALEQLLERGLEVDHIEKQTLEDTLERGHAVDRVIGKGGDVLATVSVRREGYQVTVDVSFGKGRGPSGAAEPSVPSAPKPGA